MRSINFNDNFSTKPKIALVIDNIPHKIVYTEQEISEFQKTAYNKLKKSNYNVEEVIAELRAGGMDFETAFGIALAAAVMYMMYTNRVQGFQPIRPPHHE